MNVLELYLKSHLDLDATAEKFAEALGARFERRDGLNRGGDYYLFKAFGLTLELLSNAGEVAIPESPDWPFYVLVYCDESPMTMEDLQCKAEHIRTLLVRQGIEIDVNGPK